MFKKLLIATLIGSASFSAMAFSADEAKIYGEKAMKESKQCLLLISENKYAQSFSHCKFAAQKGVPESQVGLAGFYMINGDLEQARKWFVKAANQNKDLHSANMAKEMLSRL